MWPVSLGSIRKRLEKVILIYFLNIRGVLLSIVQLLCPTAASHMRLFLHKRNSIEIPPEAQQRLQCARIAVLGCDVHGIVPAGGLGIHVSPMHQQVRNTFRVARRPAPLMTPQNSLWHRVTLPAAHRVRRTQDRHMLKRMDW